MTVDIKQFGEILDFVIDAKDAGVNIPLFVWGEGGVGKTTQIMAGAERKDCHLEILNLSQQSPEVLLGLEHKDVENEQTITFAPKWLARGMASEKRTIYFLDELNRAPKYVLQAMFSFINEGRLHTYNIKPGDIVIVAGNPDSVDYEVTGFEDKAFLSRFAHLYFEPTFFDVKKYFTTQNVHSALLSVIEDDSTLVSTVCPTKIKPSPTNRMLEKVGHALNLIAKRKDAESFLVGSGYTLFSGMIGSDIASLVVKKAKDSISLPDPSAILETGKVDHINRDSMDVVTTTNIRIAKLVKEKIDAKKWKKSRDRYIANLARYMEHIPQDAAVAFISEMRTQDVDITEVSDIIFSMAPEFQEQVLEIQI